MLFNRKTRMFNRPAVAHDEAMAGMLAALPTGEVTQRIDSNPRFASSIITLPGGYKWYVGPRGSVRGGRTKDRTIPMNDDSKATVRAVGKDRIEQYGKVAVYKSDAEILAQRGS